MQSTAQKSHPAARQLQFTVSSESRAVSVPYTWDELASRVIAAPEDARIRGMFLREIARLAPASSRRPYVPFRLYGVREYMQLLLDTAQVLHPRLSPASALIEVGLGVYSTFASSLAGLALFSATGSDFGRTCELCSRAYAMTIKPGDARLLRSGNDFAAVQLRNVWPFPEIFHCGIWLGAMRACRARGTIEVTSYVDHPCDADFVLNWRHEDP